MKSVVAYGVFGYENESTKWQYIRTWIRNGVFLSGKKKKKRDTITILPVCNNFVIFLSKSWFTSCSTYNNEFARQKKHDLFASLFTPLG